MYIINGKKAKEGASQPSASGCVRPGGTGGPRFARRGERREGAAEAEAAAAMASGQDAWAENLRSKGCNHAKMEQDRIPSGE